MADTLRALPELTRIYAPMLPHTVNVDVDGQLTEIKARWLFALPPDDFHHWTLEAIRVLSRNRNNRDDPLAWNRWHRT